ncbi:MAG: DEAD/DEAH box helicase [Halobacteriovoraceae bacterium]|nr:DEAD/DEAH box helicase [Halobacteriovoraceae bacterium]
MYEKNTFTFLLAPPAWGKTTYIIDKYRSEKLKILFISPLRALAKEVYERLNSEKNVYCELDEKISRDVLLKKQFIIISTVERFSLNFEDPLFKNIIIVLDEIHLFFYWGESFRPHLLDFIYGLPCEKISVFAMTATINSAMLSEWRDLLQKQFQQVNVIDFGNQKLKYNPNRVITSKLIKSDSYYRMIIWDMYTKKESILLFCKKRSDVLRLKRFYEKKIKFPVLYCIGGRVDQFCEELKKVSTPCLIIGTTAIGHGVNLPQIRSVYFDYPVKNKDFWLQMVARGGRDGLGLYVYAFENYSMVKTRLIDVIKFLVIDFLLCFIFFKN